MAGIFSRVGVIGLLVAMILASSCGKNDSPAGTPGLFIYGSDKSTVFFQKFQKFQEIGEFQDRDGFIGAGTPTSVQISLYAAYVSLNEDCTSSTLVADFGSTPVVKDFTSAPLLFSGSPANGTYPCLILKMKDNISFKADATAVSTHAGCTSTTNLYTFDIYRVPEVGWKDRHGDDIVSTGTVASPGNDTVTIFASTNPTAVQNGAIGASANQVVDLNSALVVPGRSTFYFDATNQIDNQTDSGQDYCWLEGPTMGFR